MPSEDVSHSDITAFEVAKGTIKLPRNIELRVLPKTSSQVFLEALPFSFVQDVAVERIGALPIYNKNNRFFAFKLTFPTPSPQAVLATQKELIGAYEHPPGTSVDTLLPTTKLVPLPVMAYEVYARIPGKDVLLQQGSRDDGGSFDGQIGISAKVTDDETHSFIMEHPQQTFIIARTYSLLQVVDATTAVAQSFSKGVSDAYAKVFGAGADPTLVVSRNAVDQLKQELQGTVLLELHLPNASANANLVKDLMLSFTSNLKVITVPDLQDANARLRLYGQDQAFVEMAPQEYKKLTESWETSDDVLKSQEKTWDNLTDISNSSDSDMRFHEQVSEFVKNEGGSSASANILSMFSGSGSMNLHLEKKTDELSDSDLHDIHQAREILKSAGSAKENFTKKGFQKWTGKDFVAGTDLVKDLDLQLVSTTELIASMRTRVSEIVARGVQPRGVERTFTPLANDMSQVVNDLLDSVGFNSSGTVGQDFLEKFIPRTRVRRGPFANFDPGQQAKFEVNTSTSTFVIIRALSPFNLPTLCLVANRLSFGGIDIHIPGNQARLLVTGNISQSLTVELQRITGGPVNPKAEVQVWLVEQAESIGL